MSEAPSAISVKHSKDTIKATKDLLQLFLVSKGSPDLQMLMTKKHTLYLSILQAGSECEDKVGCPTDQVLIARSLSAVKGRWRKASLVRAHASQDLWCFRSVVANCCRLSMQGHTKYVASEALDDWLTDHSQLEEDARCQESETPHSLDDECNSSSESETSEDEGTSDSMDSNSDDNDSQALFNSNLTSPFDPCCIEDWDIKSALSRLHNSIETPFDANISNGDAGESDVLPTLNEYGFII